MEIVSLALWRQIYAVVHLCCKRILQTLPCRVSACLGGISDLSAGPKSTVDAIGTAQRSACGAAQQAACAFPALHISRLQNGTWYPCRVRNAMASAQQDAKLRRTGDGE